eukprot:Nk52_evm1s247 gene=Nk52_evmTU1s247
MIDLLQIGIQIGILVGAIFAIVAQIVVYFMIRKWQSLPYCEIEPDTVKATTWPKEILDIIGEIGNAGGSNEEFEESCDWLNRVIHKILTEYIGKQSIEESLLSTLNATVEKLKNKSRQWGNLDISEFNLGETLPLLSCVTLEELSLHSVKCAAQLYYDGGIRLAIETEAFGFLLMLSVTVVEFRGSLVIDIRENGRVCVGFETEPYMVFDVKFKAGQFASKRVANYISNKLKHIFREKFVYPNMKIFRIGSPNEEHENGMVRMSVVDLQIYKPNGELSEIPYDAHCSISHVNGNDNSDVFQTKVVYKKTQPVWNDTFVFHNVAKTDDLRLEIWAKESSSGDINMGYVDLPGYAIPLNECMKKGMKLRMKGSDRRDDWYVTIETFFQLNAVLEDKSFNHFHASEDYALFLQSLRHDLESHDYEYPIYQHRNKILNPSENDLNIISKIVQKQKRMMNRMKTIEMPSVMGFGYNILDPKCLMMDLRVTRRLIDNVSRELRKQHYEFFRYASVDPQEFDETIDEKRREIEELMTTESRLLRLLAKASHVTGTFGFGRKKSAANSLRSISRNVPHDFGDFTYVRPRLCDFCEKILWGFSGKGRKCKMCGYNCHTKCSMFAPGTCIILHHDVYDTESLPERRSTLAVSRQGSSVTHNSTAMASLNSLIPGSTGSYQTTPARTPRESLHSHSVVSDSEMLSQQSAILRRKFGHMRHISTIVRTNDVVFENEELGNGGMQVTEHVIQRKAKRRKGKKHKKVSSEEAGPVAFYKINADISGSTCTDISLPGELENTHDTIVHRIPKLKTNRLSQSSPNLSKKKC